MTATFPNFKMLTLNDKPEIQSYLNRFPPYSDFNFFSLWSNNTKGNFFISQLNDNLIFHLMDYITLEPFFTFIGNNEIENTIEQLIQLSINEGYEPTLKLVPAHELPEHLYDTYSIQEDEDNFDYIYSTEELAVLSGSRFQNHRNFIHRFNNQHPQCSIRIIDLNDPIIQGGIVDLAYQWGKARNKPEEETDQEIKAIKRAVTHANDFKLLAVGVFDGEKMIGFMIGDIDHPEYCQTHFSKADTTYTGIYYVLYNFIAKEVLSLGYKFINNEQDLGIPGLRHSKKQWNPVYYLKKYIIKEAQPTR